MLTEISVILMFQNCSLAIVGPDTKFTIYDNEAVAEFVSFVITVYCHNQNLYLVLVYYLEVNCIHTYK